MMQPIPRAQFPCEPPTKYTASNELTRDSKPSPENQHKTLIVVKAHEFIPTNTLSRPFRIPDILKTDAVLPKKKIVVKIISGLLEAEIETRDSNSCSAPVHWFRYMAFSKDCHECNIQLESSGQNCVRLRVIKPISEGETLNLWFSQQILLTLHVPFLAPINIQDETLYMCNNCDYKCDMPNPLKIHMALNCDKEEINELWKRLQMLSENGEHENEEDIKNGGVKGENIFKVKTSVLEVANTDAICRLSESSSENDDKKPQNGCNNNREYILGLNNKRALKRNSAFKPYLNSSSTDHQLRSPSSMEDSKKMDLYLDNTLTTKFLLSSSYPTVPICDSFLNVNTSLQTVPPRPMKQSTLSKQPFLKTGVGIFHQQAAEIETLISNLGKSKQGHLCIYCGKTYSRKYGLKIHIRTHTGFKPLTCKYCLRPFGDPSNLNKHIRLHAGGKTPYKCNQCGKVLVRRRDLEKHIKSRHHAF